MRSTRRIFVIFKLILTSATFGADPESDNGKAEARMKRARRMQLTPTNL